MKIVLDKNDIKAMILESLESKGLIENREDYKIEISEYSSDYSTVTRKKPAEDPTDV